MPARLCVIMCSVILIAAKQADSSDTASQKSRLLRRAVLAGASVRERRQLTSVTARERSHLFNPLPRSNRTSPCAELGPPPYSKHVFDDRDFEAAHQQTKSEFSKIPLMGDYSRILAFMQKLASGSHGRVLVIGGSETLGVDCGQEVNGSMTLRKQECAWSARFVYWLRNVFPQSVVTLENLAYGGTPSCAHAARLGLLMELQDRRHADVIFLDPVINDFYGDDTCPECYAKDAGPPCFESMIRILHDLAPNAALFVLYTGSWKMFTPLYKSQELEIASHYNLPHVSYVELVKNNRSLWKSDGGPHPMWDVHQLMADLIVSAWGRSLNDFCLGRTTQDSTSVFPLQPLLNKSVRIQHESCLRPRSVYSSYSFAVPGFAVSSNKAPAVLNGDWQLFEDRPGKPGWISTVVGSRLRFSVAFGSNPELTVIYLRSYASLGDARVSVQGCAPGTCNENRSVVLKGIWEPMRKGSQAETVHFGTQNLPLQANTTMDLVFELLPRKNTKFKILDIASC